MDISIVFLGIGIALLVGYYFGFRRRKKLDNIGEAAVRKVLTQYCRISTAHLMNNITLEYGEGTTQIDHILFTQNGILVIETKHMKGWIFANEKNKTWTQVIYKWKNKFQNPLLQNKLHTNAVNRALSFLPAENVMGITVFTGDAEFKTEIPDSVLYLSELVSYVDQLRLGSIADNMLQYCIGKIEYDRFELTAMTDLEHQRYLEKKFGEINK